LAGLFKGRILSYEPRTCEISVFYDFKDAAQLGDFVSVATASASLSSNVKVEAGKMKISVGNSWVELFGSDRYMSGQVRISMHYKVKDLMNNVFILFSGENSKGKAPQVQCGVAGHSDSNCRQGCRFEEIEPPGRTVKKVLGSTDAILPLEGQLEVGCKDREYFLKCDGKDVLKYSAPAANDHRGLRLAAGFDMYIEFQNMTITGRLDPSWLKSALSTDKR
jgi:hypothetical protein